MNDTRYLYEVRPVKPIIISGQSIRRPCSVQLNKAEVMEYMKSASIYRRFANTTMEPIKVTGENLDSLHQQTYNPNCKSVTSVPTFVVSKETTPTPPIKQEETVIPPVVEEKETEKKSNEEESSVISSESNEHQIETPTEEVVEENTIAENEEQLSEGDSSSEMTEEKVETPIVDATEKKEEQPAQTVAPINLKGGNQQNKNNNGKNKNNYKK